MPDAPNALSTGERSALETLASQSRQAHSQRARAILHWADHRDADGAAQASGLLPSQARYWIRAFGRRRLEIFPEDALAAAGRTPAPRLPEPAPASVSGDEASPSAGEPADEPPKRARRRRFNLSPADPMSEAGRRIMAFHFARLRKYQDGAAQGDEDAIHDMRVAIRRIRAAFRIAGPYYKRKTVKALRGELRALARQLGGARDLDVIIGHGLAFAERQPADAPRLDAWFDHLRARRAGAQNELIAYLGSKRFARLVEDFEAFVGEPGAGARSKSGPAGEARVCDVLPAAIWAQYSRVRSFETIDSPTLESLHALRIEFKRLRYLLEFFREVLGRRVNRLIKMTVGAQDALGLLHDADVTAGMLRSFVAESAGLAAGDLAAVAAYLADVQAELHARQDEFADVWKQVTDRPFRAELARLLSAV